MKILFATVLLALVSCGGPTVKSTQERTYCDSMCEYENEYRRPPRAIIVQQWDETHDVVCHCFAGGTSQQIIVER